MACDLQGGVVKERPIIFSAPMVRAILSGAKTQTRRLVTAQTSLFDGGPCSKKDWAQLRFDGAWVDNGPSPAGNPGPYLRVPRVTWGDEFVHRIYPRIRGGDRLYVREAFRPVSINHKSSGAQFFDIQYREGFGVRNILDGLPEKLAAQETKWETSITDIGFGRWKPSIHMPKWASRITLEVTGVRVERLQEITPTGAIAEGVTSWGTKENEKRIFDESGHRREEPTGPGVFDGRERGVPYLVNAFAELWDGLNLKRAPWALNPWVFVVEFRRIKG